MPELSQVLLWTLFLPLFGILAVLASGTQARNTALAVTVITFLLSLFIMGGYDPELKAANGDRQLIQMQVDAPWLGTVDGESTIGPNIRFTIGVDGISLWLIGLTTLLMIPSVLVSYEAIKERPAIFYSLLLLLEFGMIGVFVALDIILFYIFFEFTLIPLFFLIGLWGGYERRFAARKFFIFTLAGSVLTFLGLLYIVLSHAWLSGSSQLTFSIPQLIRELPGLTSSGIDSMAYWEQVSPWIFVALFAGFAIKVPLFPFHTWLPLAHVEAPTAGSVLLAGVLLKIGSYGFLRFMLPLVPEACFLALPWVAGLAIIGIIYGALLALAQDDIKKLVAYSSVSHMGFCLLGLFALNSTGITGGMLQMINHGLSTGALFALVGMLYERYHSRDIEAFGGLMRKFPYLAFFFVLVTFSSIGLPGLNGFTGEVTALMGMFHRNQTYAIYALSGIILGAWYMLQLVRRVFYGRFREPAHEGHNPLHAFLPDSGAHSNHGSHAGHGAHAGHGHEHGHGSAHVDLGHPMPDLNVREWCALVPLAVMIVWIGLFPQFFISRMEPSIQEITKILDRVEFPPTELARAAEQERDKP